MTARDVAAAATMIATGAIAAAYVATAEAERRIAANAGPDDPPADERDTCWRHPCPYPECSADYCRAAHRRAGMTPAHMPGIQATDRALGGGEQ